MVYTVSEQKMDEEGAADMIRSVAQIVHAAKVKAGLAKPNL